jgi:hypothetical protein
MHYTRGMASSEIFSRATLLRTDVSDEYVDSVIKVGRIRELGITLAVYIATETRCDEATCFA